MLRRTPHNQLSVLLRKEQVRNCKNVYSNVSVQKRLEKLPIPDLYYQLTRMDRPTLKAGYKFLPPTAETHPHLVKAGELAPGITAAEFKERRDVVLKTVEDNSLLVIPNSDLYARSLDIPFEYRPESNFYYLTGFTEPGSILVMEKFAGAKQPKFSLYVKPHAIDAAKAFIGEVHSLESFPAHIAEKIQLKVKYVYTSDVYTNPAATLMLYDALPVDERKDLIPRVMKMQFTATRAYKREAERKLLRDATEITNNAFQAVLKTVQPGLTENQIASVFEFASKISGSQTLAFPPTFAVGYNGSDPLYIRNNQALKENQLLTVEAGVEYNMYSTCFGRTVPVSGRFTPLQKRVYELMLGVQKNVLAGCLSHGRTCTSQMHAEYMQGAVEILKQLRADKLVEISDEELDLAAQKCEYGPTFAKFFPMTVEQTVKVNGIDVAEDGFLGYHVAEGGNIIPLESTQCYSSGFRLCFPAEATKSAELKGSVFNLRDMVIINKNAPPEVLTGHFPTSVDELEAAMAKSADFPLASFIKNNQL